jgi:hypothetical protein
VRKPPPRPPKGTRFGGRQKGSQNKVTLQAKEAFQLAFEGLGGVPWLVRWAKKNPTEFAKLYARNIPQQVTGDGGGAVKHEHDLTPQAKLDRARAAARVVGVVDGLAEDS